MYSKLTALRLIRIAVFMAVMYVALQIGIAFGVEKKNWLQQGWELIVGGSIGALAGLTFFLIFGAIGWVCGALFGAIGVVWLMLGGALGGLGLGAVFNILRQPQKYNFNWFVLVPVLVVGYYLAKRLSSFAVDAASKLILSERSDLQDGTNLTLHSSGRLRRRSTKR